MKDSFKGKKALITGGLGFIGSNLAIRLVELGADVTLTDAMLTDYGGNLFNIEPIRERVRVNFSDIRDRNVMNYLVPENDYIFHLAGQVCHVMSLTDPFPDIDINIKGTAVVMEAIRRHNPKAKVVFSGTRGEYGPAASLPVNEEAPTNPKGMYELSNLTAEKIVKLYNDTHNIAGVMLRITNTYGPRGQMKHSRFGVVNWFVRLALDGKPITVFDTGEMIRDFLYVDDCIEAILMAAASPKAAGEVLNVGVDNPQTIREMAETICGITGTEIKLVPPTPERAVLEPGNFYSDITRIRNILGWEPTVGLKEGLTRTVEYYRKNKKHYW
ncbi:MAG: NAD-dependent epimerase/dehydratase family protein [Deltaproteobacteria bacterium]|uniref:NAD-dependent epimerase/dehydratase family protein n=1 Tax=Candidatus Zymogenus saltonus TaxID=2844893 RepID=A0A9D8KEM1_9DELT|nr:NAD-dependent epimerase/dehydratase family protein [Candidatus Zymogenus saltonus]